VQDRTRPLGGRSILITRPEKRGASLAAALAELGALVEHRPSICFEPAWSRNAALKILDDLERFRWIVLTSPTAAEFFLEAAGDADASLKEARFAVPGEGTAGVLRTSGIEPALVAERAYAATLAAELAERGLRDVPVLWPRPESARRILAEILRGAGARLTEVVLYRTLPAAGCPEILEDLAAGRYDAVLYGSPSSFRCLFQTGGPGPADLPDRLRSVAIGKVTAEAIRKAGGRVDRVADPPGEKGILAALVDLFSS